jgi:starch phosphorylase
VFYLARENKEQKQKNREFEQLKENLKLRFVNTAHVMWGRDIKELT